MMFLEGVFFTSQENWYLGQLVATLQLTTNSGLKGRARIRELFVSSKKFIL